MRRALTVFVILFLLTGCQTKEKILQSDLRFAEIYKDKRDSLWLRFFTHQDTLLRLAPLDDIVIISTGIKVERPVITCVVREQDAYARKAHIEVGSQEEMHLWRDAISKLEPRVLYPLFEFKEDEIKN